MVGANQALSIKLFYMDMIYIYIYLMVFIYVYAPIQFVPGEPNVWRSLDHVEAWIGFRVRNKFVFYHIQLVYENEQGSHACDSSILMFCAYILYFVLQRSIHLSHTNPWPMFLAFFNVTSDKGSPVSFPLLS